MNLAALLAQVLHAALVLAVVPLLVGGMAWGRARLQGRAGPHLLQPWRDIRKALRKRPLLAEAASPISGAAPLLAAASALVALMFVPSFARGMALSPLADLVLVLALLAAGPVLATLAALDAGDAAGGAAAGRRVLPGVLAVPAVLAALLPLAAAAGTTGLDGIAAALPEGRPGTLLPLLLAGLALLALAVTARLPLEVAGAVLHAEASGRHFALWQVAEALRLAAWLMLLAAVLLPQGMAPPGFAPLAWLLGALVFPLKLGLLAALLLLAEAMTGAVRLARLPAVMGVAAGLAALAALLLWAARVPA
jgi:formate hydrogenlyase subunit 4